MTGLDLTHWRPVDKEEEDQTNQRTWGPSSHGEYELGYVLTLWHWKRDGEITEYPLKSLL